MSHVPQKYKKSNKINKNENFEKIKEKQPLDYVLKNIPAKFDDDWSILGQIKLEMMKLTDRFFFLLVDSWSYRSETHPQKNLRSIKENQRRKWCAIIRPQGFGRIIKSI